MVPGTPGLQMRRTLENVAAILDAGDASLDDVVKSTVYVKDMWYYE